MYKNFITNSSAYMSIKNNIFHHFKGNNLSPSEKIQRKVVQLLLNSKVKDSKRDSSIVFELKHSSGVIEAARILAERRNLNVTLAEVIAALHDIEVVVNGSYKEHAKRGALIAKKMLSKISGFSDEEKEIVIDAIAHHSEKENHTNNPYCELIKDADAFSCSYFEGSETAYRKGKSPLVFQHTVDRIKKVRKELGLPEKPVFK